MLNKANNRQIKSGFTLIEISIVLVIIGLIIGGILTGKDLINGAEIRSQITQIEKYNTAVRTFQNKYGNLPGDIPDPAASRFGFQPRGSNPGEGDGDGVLAGNCGNTAGGISYIRNGCGELAVFWEDLSASGLTDTFILGVDKKPGQNYPNTSLGAYSNITMSSTPTIKDWLPQAKIGYNNFVYVYSMAGMNYFSVSSVTLIGWDIVSTANPGLTVQQAYNIDKKIDDGLPQSGVITACYINYGITSGNTLYAAGGGQQGDGGYSAAYMFCTPDTTLTAPASTNCFDNNGVSGGTQKYSVTQNSNTQNCALSFKFQ